MSGARARAQEVLKAAKINAPPVDVEGLARSYGVQLSFEPFRGGISGMLFRDQHRQVIGINAAHPRTRQRFTIAHELGHLLLHEDRTLIVDRHVYRRDDLSSTGTEQEEIDANAFAAELLMPEAFVEEAANDLVAENPAISANQLVSRLGAVFEVSAQAMEIRLGTVGILSPLIVESG